MKAILSAVFLVCVASSSFAATPSADALMAQASKQASTEKKVIYLRFSASWCG